MSLGKRYDLLLLSIILLLVLTLRGAQTSVDVAVDWTNMEAAYNPSLVEYGDRYMSALKRTTFRKANGKTFWVNHLYLCVGQQNNLHDLRCQAYNPWPEPYLECEFGKNVRDGKTDVTGLGDVKVWVWPGKGLYTIFGRKPERVPGGGQFCTSKVVYDQWIAQVRPEQGAGPWRLHQPLRLHIIKGYKYPDEASYIMEKNWMPWAYRFPNGTETLFVTHMINPHRILEVAPNGACEVRHETVGKPGLFARFAAYDVHGGPPVVHVDGKLSGNGLPYYLGIMHHIEMIAPGAISETAGPARSKRSRSIRKIKRYRHFAYKFQPEPPFEITDISDELNLTFYRHAHFPTKAHVAYVAGLYVNAKGTVYVSYGAGDRAARLMSMSVAELESTFTGKVAFLGDG